MSIITQQQKKNKCENLKEYVRRVYSRIFSPLKTGEINYERNIICGKCKNWSLIGESCPNCGYKPLSKREVAQNTNFLYKNFYRAQSDTYEIKEVDSRLAYVSDIGQIHHENQDSGFVSLLNNWKFLGVADGVSRSNSPKIASQYALEKSFEYLNTISLDSSNIVEEIKNAIFYAHAQIQAIKLDYIDPDVDPPEATIVIALVQDNKAYIGWVGDSRAYTIDSKSTQVLTRDDSWVMYAVDKGMSFKEANNSPMAHAITQCMGMNDVSLVPHVIEVDITGKDLLLCSDGLWNYFDDEQLLHELYRKISGTAKDIANKLVKAANIKGGNDNITVAIYKSDCYCTS